MITQQRIRLTKLALALSIALSAAPTFAQNTTSAIGGRVSGADGKPAAGATVSIVHAESGTVSNVVTDAEGRYVARGLRAGGPYTIIITKNGVTEKKEDVYTQLAETASVDATLGAPIATVTVTGSAARSQVFSRANMGTGTSISATELQTQASIQRNLQDYARIDPRVSQTDKERGEMSVAGQNSRYNTMTIDGVNVSDTFGLEANGSPTARQPISIEAIQSVQVNVANYDVTQKGYTGGNINAATKSGTNQWKGAGYYVFRDDRLAGKRYNVASDTYTDAPPFEESTKGGWVSGPLIKDKLFFFALLEESKSSRNSPDYGPVGSNTGTTVGITQGEISQAQDIAKRTWGMDIGGTDVPQGSQMVSREQMLKLDWNINENHRANVRYAKTSQSEPVFPGFSATGVTLDSQFYKNVKSIETVVAQVFSDWTPTFSTEFKAANRNYDSVPESNSRLPSMSLQFSGPLPADAPSGTRTGNRYLNFGTEYARQMNILRSDALDLYAGANWTMGDHEIKFGADYNNNRIYNAYLQNVFGSYTFGCENRFSYSFGSINCATASLAQVDAAVLENFSRGRPSSYSVQMPTPGKTLNDGVAQFMMRNTGLFLQDTYSVNKNLTLSYGFRVDAATVGDHPLQNSAAAQPMVAGSVVNGVYTRQSGGFGYDNTVTIDGERLFQPRFGFNYHFDTARPMQLRGGLGLFQGAAATVWLSNPFSNPGVSTRVISCSGTGATKCPSTDGTFSPNPDAQNTVAGATPASNVDFLSPDLRQPSVWKGNLAFETELPWMGLIFGAEYLRTQNKDSIYYEHLNLGAASATGSDGRQLFWSPDAMKSSCYQVGNGSVSVVKGCSVSSKALSNLSYGNVLVAKDTDKGAANLITVSLTSPLKKGLGWSMAYTHTDATEVSPLTSSVSNSNWGARSVFNPNEDVAANSAYLVKNRVNAKLDWQHQFFDNYKTSFGLFYEGRSGKPYSWTVNNDLNGDGYAGNDLMYIPKAFGSGEVTFYGDTATDHTNEQHFWDIVNANKVLRNAAGGVIGRNSDFAPWTNSFDMRISQQIPGMFARNKATFTLDFLNVGNLLNKKWGHINEVLFQSAGGQARSFVDYAGLDAQGRYVYSVRPNVEDLSIRQNKGESQWAIQATFKYEF